MTEEQVEGQNANRKMQNVSGEPPISIRHCCGSALCSLPCTSLLNGGFAFCALRFAF
jgi:hypothetical protein